MTDFLEDIDMNITTYLNHSKNTAIKKVLDMLDMGDMPDSHRKKIRQVVLDELNEFYTSCCRVLTCIQEKQDGENS